MDAGSTLAWLVANSQEFAFYCCVGLLEWLIAGRRSSAMVDGEVGTATVLVLIECLLGWYVIDMFMPGAAQANWPVAVGTSVGAAAGISIETRRRRAKIRK